MSWQHRDPQGASASSWDKAQNFISQEEYDPTGVDVGATNPFAAVGGGEEEFGLSRVNLIPDDPSGKYSAPQNQDQKAVNLRWGSLRS